MNEEDTRSLIYDLRELGEPYPSGKPALVIADGTILIESADAIDYWHSEAHKLAKILMSEYTWTHEYKVEEVDAALKPYLGTEHDAPAEPPSTT